jgi:hypothetical protein
MATITREEAASCLARRPLVSRHEFAEFRRTPVATKRRSDIPGVVAGGVARFLLSRPRFMRLLDLAGLSQARR